MSDNIDYSDIPETNEEFWEEAKVTGVSATDVAIEIPNVMKQDLMKFIDMLLEDKETHEKFLNAISLKIEKGLENK